MHDSKGLDSTLATLPFGNSFRSCVASARRHRSRRRFARRRSKLSGLDLGALGDGDGYLTRDARHLTLTLLRHKTATAEPEVYVVPRAGNRVAVEAIERWLAVARVQPGQAILRRVRKNG